VKVKETKQSEELWLDKKEMVAYAKALKNVLQPLVTSSRAAGAVAHARGTIMQVVEYLEEWEG